jgi:hypothetical protein
MNNLQPPTNVVIRNNLGLHIRRTLDLPIVKQNEVQIACSEVRRAVNNWVYSQVSE